MDGSGSAMAFPNSRIRKRSRATSSTFCMNPKSENKISRLRILAAAFGVMVVVLATLGLHDPLAPMSSYTAALMALNQIAPPLLFLPLQRSIGKTLQGHGKAAALAGLFLDQ